MDNLKRKYSFEYDPNVIKMLGENMYSTVFSALSELIANSHDAAATNVWVTIGKDEISIEDDGIGMDYKTITENFLRIAYDSRSKNEYVVRDGIKKPRMGRKGVGKLAALSLGKHAYFYSKTTKDIVGCEINLDEAAMVQPLNNERMVFEKTKDNITGTMVVIKQLRKNVSSQKKKTISELQKRFFFNNQYGFNIYFRNEGQKFTKPMNWEIKYRNYLDIFLSFDSGTYNNFVGNLKYSDLQNLTLGKKDDRVAFKSINDFNVSNIIDDKITAEITAEIKDKYGITDATILDKDFIEITYTHESGKKCILTFKGWIGTYRTLYKHDSIYEGSGENLLNKPDNNIYLYSRNKLGLHNLLSIINTKQIFESYMVGKINIDGLEQSDLPDIATSNRQNYSIEDSRMLIVLKVITFLKRELIAVKKNCKLDPEVNKLDEVVPKTEKAKDFLKDFKQELEKYSGEEKKKKNKAFANIVYKQDALLDAEKQSGDEVIFVSHSSKDENSYKIITEVLKKCFIGLPSENVYCTSLQERKPYTNIFNEIAGKIISSVSNIYLLSENFQQSIFTQQEVGAGWILGYKLNKRINYPVMANGFYETVRTCSNDECDSAPKSRNIAPFDILLDTPSISDKYTLDTNVNNIYILIKEIEKDISFKLYDKVLTLEIIESIIVKHDFFKQKKE